MKIQWSQKIKGMTLGRKWKISGKVKKYCILEKFSKWYYSTETITLIWTLINTKLAQCCQAEIIKSYRKTETTDIETT